MSRPNRYTSITIDGKHQRDAIVSLIEAISGMGNVPDAGDVNEVISLLQYALEGHEVVIGIADADADLSPEEVAARIGSSRQHVYRLIDAGRLKATTLPDSRRRRIRMRDLAAYERDVQRREEKMAEWSSTLARLDPDGD